ncbi:uncharacterized protein LOC128997775 [Macrosteles quadrilineatus]|uniref:uncharacterized protein LOC128997775 n=1 Tax=Macrosteles quadrilineatus TaxID=74068 RepID=UPI0023E11D0A|nr:uncharacterized protein LOC128997775 [Macrosteles quadrilineatus]
MACLTLPSYTPKINTVQQLVEQNFVWGKPYEEDNLSKHLDTDKYWQREFAKNFIVYNKSNLKKMLLSKRFALVVQQIENCDYLFMDDPIDEDIADNFRVMKEQNKKYRCAIAFRKRSPLLPAFDGVLKRFIETGLVKHLKEDAERRFQKPAYKRILSDLDNGIRSKEIAAFTLNNYNFMIYFYAFGMLISTICFILELCSNRLLVL